MSDPAAVTWSRTAADHWSHRPLQAADGMRLEQHLWPASDAASGQVLLVHGLGEHLGRYHHVAAALNACGYQVQGVDLRGHGRSDGKRGFVRRWQDYVLDLEAIAATIEGPYLVVAHSMGALVALDFLRSPRPVPALALSGPLLGFSVQAPWWKLKLAGLLSVLLPSLSLSNELDAGQVCSDPEVVAAYQADPLNFSSATPRWFTEMRQALVRVHQAAPAFQLPLHIQYGALDQIICQRSLLEFAAHWGGTVETRVWPDGRHEVFNERFSAEVLQALCDWLQSAGTISNSSTE